MKERKNDMTKRTMWTAAAVLGAVLVVPTGLTAQDNCELRGEMVLTERAGESLRLEAGAGKLVITGRSGIDYIRVDATLCASDQERMDALNVSLDGGTLDTDYPRNGASGWFGRNRYARIDLVVQVPAGTNLRVDDSSGSIEITGVGDVDLRDGSGTMRLRDVASVVIEDGPGSLRIEDVAGNVTVEDGSGSLRIRSVGGDVVISDDSGSIEVGAVGGTVRIDGGGSGSVTVRDVDGDLVVTDTRRSRIRFSDIRGVLDLPPERKKGRGW